MLGLSEFIVLGGVAVLVLNWKKLPALGSALARSAKEFRKSLSEEERPRIRDVEPIEPSKKDPN